MGAARPKIEALGACGEGERPNHEAARYCTASANTTTTEREFIENDDAGFFFDFGVEEGRKPHVGGIEAMDDDVARCNHCWIEYMAQPLPSPGGD